MGKRGEKGRPLDQITFKAQLKVGASFFSARKGFFYGDLNAFRGRKNKAHFLGKIKVLWNFSKNNPGVY